MRKFATMAGLVLAATSLGGCQALFGSKVAEADIGDLDMSEYFEQRLAMGKAHLAANRPTRAITAFRQASYDPRYAGEALNGMAIAYDRIGRPDLAARYFAQAVRVAPGDERFARNLARLEGRMPAGVPAMPELEPVEMAAEQAAEPALRGAVTLERPTRNAAAAVTVEKAPPARVATLSQGQVAVATDERSAVRTAIASEAPARVVVETRSAAQRTAMRARRGAQARKAYPIRIVLNDGSGTLRP